jgi:hypothetical protein
MSSAALLYADSKKLYSTLLNYPNVSVTQRKRTKPIRQAQSIKMLLYLVVNIDVMIIPAWVINPRVVTRVTGSS